LLYTPVYTAEDRSMAMHFLHQPLRYSSVVRCMQMG